MSHARSSSLTSLSLASPSAAASEVPTEDNADEVAETTISQLVYAGRDPIAHGFKAPTTADIPQIRLPRIDLPDENILSQYGELSVSQQVLGDLSSEISESELPPIDAVPTIFFDENFELDNPRVFDNVSSGDWAILQEQLGWYVDIVEMHLIHEISRASSGFFAATSTFSDIEAQTSVISAEIDELRSTISLADDEVVGKARQAQTLIEKLDGVKEFMRALKLVSAFASGVDNLYSKVNESSEWSLDSLQAVKDLDSQSLRSVKALAPHFEKLDIVEGQFREKFTQALSDVLLTDLRAHLSTVSRSETLQRLSAYHSRRRARRPTLSASSSESWRVISEELRQNVEKALAASAEASSTDEAFTLLSEAVQSEIKGVVKAHLPNNDELAKTLHSLSAMDAEAMCQGLFTSLSEAFRRLSSQEKLVLDVATQHGVTPPEQGYVLSIVLRQVDSRISRVLRVRKDPTAYLSASQYCRFFSLCRSFCEECEAITGLQPTELTEFLAAETKLFVHTLTADCESVLRTILDADTWRKDEIFPSVQSDVDGIVECGTLDPSVWLCLGDIAADYSESIPLKEKNRSPTVTAGSDSFFVSKSALQLASTLAGYLRLVVILPSTYVPEVAMAILELVSIFNTRARHLVLGFGATRSAGLRHISVRHLAVTSESLRFVIVLMPHIQQCIARHSVRDDLTLLFDRAIGSLSDHQAEIHQKLVKLMTDKIQSCSQAISEQNWSIPIEGEAHQYMLNLVKDTSTVARIVEDTLPAPLALALMTEVFDAYKPRLLEAYTAVTVSDQNEKTSLLKDLSYFREKAIAISGAGNIAEIIYETVDGFVTPENPPIPDITPSGRNSQDSTNKDTRSLLRHGGSESMNPGSAVRKEESMQRENVDNATTKEQSEAHNTTKRLLESGSNDVNEGKGAIKDGHRSQGQVQKNEEVSEQKIPEEEERKLDLGKKPGKAADQEKEEEARFKAEEEEARRQAAEEEAKRRAAEEDARLKAEEEEARLKAEEEKARLKAEEEKARLKAEEEEARVRAEEEEVQIKAAQEEAKCKAEEEEARLKAEEEEARLRAEEEEARLRAEEEEARLRAEEEEAQIKAAQEEAKCKAEGEAQLKAAEEDGRPKSEEAGQNRKEKEPMLNNEKKVEQNLPKLHLQTDGKIGQAVSENSNQGASVEMKQKIQDSEPDQSSVSMPTENQADPGTLTISHQGQKTSSLEPNKSNESNVAPKDSNSPLSNGSSAKSKPKQRKKKKKKH